MSTSTQKNSYQAYSRANHTVAKTRQVVMLYDGIIRNLQQAREAMKEKRIEDRFHKLVRASEIIAGLQMSLDFESGAEAAQVLYDFYSSADARIMQLHRTNDAEACEVLIEEVKQMRELWNKIDQEYNAAQASVNNPVIIPTDVTMAVTPSSDQQPPASPPQSAVEISA